MDARPSISHLETWYVVPHIDYTFDLNGPKHLSGKSRALLIWFRVAVAEDNTPSARK
jgi:hypothetical protein